MNFDKFLVLKIRLEQWNGYLVKDAVDKFLINQSITAKKWDSPDVWTGNTIQEVMMFIDDIIVRAPNLIPSILDAQICPELVVTPSNFASKQNNLFNFAVENQDKLINTTKLDVRAFNQTVYKILKADQSRRDAFYEREYFNPIIEKLVKTPSVGLDLSAKSPAGK